MQEILQRYKDLQDIIAILGMDELSDEDKIVVPARAQDRALPLPAVLRRRGVHRHAGQVRAAHGHDPRLQGDRRGRSTTTLPEQAFFMVGGIDEAVEKAKLLAGTDA